jgi:hypothetical protein
MKTSNETVNVTEYLPKRTVSRMRAEARRQGITIEEAIRQAVAAYLVSK